jgi:DNA-binding IclR family transcriptional regulator
VGGRLPMHATAVGRAMLAFEEDWVRDAVLVSDLAQRTEFTKTDPALIGKDLERIRAQGFAIASEEVRLGSCSIAVPVFDGEGHVVAALGMVLPTSRAHQLEHNVPILLGTAERIQSGIARVPASTLRNEVLHRRPAR